MVFHRNSKSVLSFFILWLLAIIYLYSIELWQIRIPNKQPVIYEPIWRVATVYASPLSYFSISSIIDSIIFPPIFLLFLVIFSRRFPSTTYSPIFKAPSVDDLHPNTSAPPSASLKQKQRPCLLQDFNLLLLPWKSSTRQSQSKQTSVLMIRRVDPPSPPQLLWMQRFPRRADCPQQHRHTHSHRSTHTCTDFSLFGHRLHCDLLDDCWGYFPSVLLYYDTNALYR